MMQGFPPAPEGQVTLANWRTAPYSRWAFQHAGEIVPSAPVPNEPANVWHLPEAPRDLDSLPIADGGGAIALAEALARTDTDGFAVLHRGRLVMERYAHGMTAESPHILMSVSKSVLGLLAEILIGQGILDPEAAVERILPELAATGFAGATLRQLLDMRAGLRWDEDYLAAGGPIIACRKATNWNPLEPGEAPSDLRSFFGTLTESDGPHGGRFRYISPNTDLLAWVIERAAGRRYADLLSDRLWRPMGAERGASITVDRLGAPRAAGGLSMTLRDLARIGQLLVQDGKRGQRQVLPAGLVGDLLQKGDAEAWAAGDFAADFERLPMHYRSKWYVLRGERPLLFALGIHGQQLYLDPTAQVVVAKFSSRPAPLDNAAEMLHLRMALAIRDCLSKGE